MFNALIEFYFRQIMFRFELSIEENPREELMLVDWRNADFLPKFSDIEPVLMRKSAIILHRDELFFFTFLSQSIRRLDIPKENQIAQFAASILKSSISRLKGGARLVDNSAFRCIRLMQIYPYNNDFLSKLFLESSRLKDAHLLKLEILKKALIKQVNSPINGLDIPDEEADAADLNLNTFSSSLEEPFIFEGRLEALLSIYDATDQESFTTRLKLLNDMNIEALGSFSNRYNLLHNQKIVAANFRLMLMLFFAVFSLLINSSFKNEDEDIIRVNGFEFASVIAFVLYFKAEYDSIQLDRQFNLVKNTESLFASVCDDFKELKMSQRTHGFFEQKNQVPELTKADGHRFQCLMF